MKNLLTLLALAAFSLINAQPYSVRLEAVNIANFGGVQSFAVGQHNGKILLVGGRLDGLHRRQPWASFDAAGHNNQLIVIDPASQAIWTSGLSSLPTTLQDQLKSTNMSFIQSDTVLYLIGGYGMNSSGNHVTFNNLTAVNLPGVIQAVINQQSLATHFRYTTDANFKVTGSQLYKVYNDYYLVGGQLFDGVYNPMGPTHGPGFTQVYTNEVRRFSITDDGSTLSASFKSPYQHSTLLHKRDYNAVPTFHNGNQGVLALSGVFQPTVDLPWTNAVYIDSTGFAEVANFTQYYNHYHSAKTYLYDSATATMHYYIYGGIAQYYLQNGSRVQDNDVPFVKTISHLRRTANGTLTETPLSVEMPDYLGAGAEFVPLESLDMYPNEIIDMTHFQGDSIAIGYIIGGIKSSAPNIFFINTGTESEATRVLYKVYLVKSTIGLGENNNTRKASIQPNPSRDVLNLKLQRNAEIEFIQWIDASGKITETEIETALTEDELKLNVNDMARGVYTLQVIYRNGDSDSFKVAIQ